MSRLSDEAVTRLADGLVTPALPARYVPLEVIGRGGMGVVWRARDRRLGRDVAVKVLGEHVAEGEVAARLRREARILARLEHPGIVAVHDAGTLPDGRTWYAMRLVEGERLDVAAPGFATLGEAVRVLVRVAETVAYAHTRGVLHRDLTPRNVMLGRFGDVLILDWGVARDAGGGDAAPARGAGRQTRINEEDRPESAAGGADAAPTPREDLTAHGTVLGTPGFMAPEQAAGSRADERTDVYGLGALLGAVLDAMDGPVPRPLAAIRDRARSPDPGDRYPDALALQGDLVRFQDGYRVSAYREGPLDAARRLWGRHRALILLVAAYLAVRLAIVWWRGI